MFKPIKLKSKQIK